MPPCKSGYASWKPGWARTQRTPPGRLPLIPTKPLRSAGRRPPAGSEAASPDTGRALLPVEQVDEIVAVVPERCQHCGEPFPEFAARRRGRAWRHQVVELLPLAVRVTEYQMAVRRCLDCGKRTRADLPAGVPRWPLGHSGPA